MKAEGRIPTPQWRPNDESAAGRRGHAFSVGGSMFHQERHPWRKLVVIGGSLLLAGCASTREKPASMAPPGLGGESPSVFGSGEGIGGNRAARRPAFTALEKRRSAGDDSVAAKSDDDPGIVRTSFLKGGGLSSMFKRDCGPKGCKPGAGGRVNGKELLEASGANLGAGDRGRPRRDMGYNNPAVPRELRKTQHPIYVVEPPDVLYIEALELIPNRPISGERLVRPDGTISLGYYGQISVAGLTLPEIEEKIRKRLEDYVNAPEVYVDVAYFNSKIFYVLGQTQQTGRLPITGNETVLDGITLAGGLTNFADKNRIFLARPNPGGGCDQVFHVDYRAVTECGDTRTNYQLLPGDRVIVMPTSGYAATVWMDNYLTPVERVTNLFALFRFAVSSNNR
jgi:polysaccharide biosynthesis/export protein